MKPEFVSYLASLLFQGGIKPAHLPELRILEWNTSWTQSQDEPKTFQFYVLPLPILKERAGFDHSYPPPPRRALRTDQTDALEHVIMSHATSEGGAISILREAKLRPSRLHFSYSQSFFGLGFRKSNDQATNVKEGGEGVCVDQTLRGGLVHHQRAKLWVCNVQNHFLSAVTWRSDADPPTGLL